MAKRKNRTTVVIQDNEIYTTANQKYQVKILGVSPETLIMIDNKHEPVPVPTYCQSADKMPPGAKPKEYPLNEKILEVDGDPEETRRRKDAWAEYEAANLKQEQAHTEEIFEVAFEDGIYIVNDDVDDLKNSWIAKCARRGFEISDDPYKKHMQFLYGDVFSSMGERFQVLSMVLAKSGVQTSEDKIAEAMKPFQVSMEKILNPRSSDTKPTNGVGVGT